MPTPTSPIHKRANIAVLIDGDNAQPALLEQILLEAAKHGHPSIRRIYGDWTATNMSGWKTPLLQHAIRPVQQFRNIAGKNATDSALIIDAMDILHSRHVTAFCIVSSDSDFTSLATRIREDGIQVIGIGKRTTPHAFVNACDLFIYTEELVKLPLDKQPINTTNVLSSRAVAAELTAPKAKPLPKSAVPSQPKQPTPAKAPVPIKPKPQKATAPQGMPLKLLRKAFNQCDPVNGWVNLEQLNSTLTTLNPAFKTKTFGHSTLRIMLESIPKEFQFKLPISGKTIYVGLTKP